MNKKIITVNDVGSSEASHQRYTAFLLPFDDNMIGLMCRYPKINNFNQLLTSINQKLANQRRSD